MAAETVITHNVITSGQLPEHMGWSNEVYRDVDDVLGEGAGAYHVISSLSCEPVQPLIAAQRVSRSCPTDQLGIQFKYIVVGQKTNGGLSRRPPADRRTSRAHRQPQRRLRR